MNSILKTTAAAALTLVAAIAQAAPAIDANVEMDTNWANNDRGFSQNGRVEMNVAGKTDKGGFVAGRASFLATKTSAVAVDDMWVQFGNDSADVKLGRFEAADLFAVGKDTIVEDTGVSGYRNVLRGRFGGSTAHAAVTVKASSELSVELGLIADAKNTAVRPVVTYAAGGMTVRAGLENGKNAAGDKVEGFGLTVGLPMAGGTVNASIGSGKVAGVKGSSAGLNATIGDFGIGYIMDKNDGKKTESNIYAAYSLPLFGTGATITPAIAYSKGEPMVTAAGTKDTATTVRVRVNYTF